MPENFPSKHSPLGREKTFQQKTVTHEFFAQLRRRRGLLLGIVGGFVLLASLVHWFRPSYRASAVLQLKREDSGVLSVLMGGKGSMSAPSMPGLKSASYLDNQLLYLQSHEFFLSAARIMVDDPKVAEDVERLVRQRGWLSSLFYSTLGDPSLSETRAEALAKRLGKITKFSKSGYDHVQVTVGSGKPEVAVRLANFVGEATIQILRRTELLELEKVRQFVQMEISETEKHIELIDSSVVNYRKKSKLALDGGVPAALMQMVNSLQQSLSSNLLQQKQNDVDIASLSETLRTQEERLVREGTIGGENLDAIIQLRRKIEGYANRKSTMLAQGFDPNSIAVKDLDQEIAMNGARLKELMTKVGGREGSVFLRNKNVSARIESLKSHNQRLAVEADILRKGIQDQMQPIGALPETQRALNAFGRSSHIEYAALQALRGKLMELTLYQSSLNEKVKIVEPATIPGIRPRLNLFPKLLIAIGLSIILGLGGLWFAEIYQTTVTTAQDISDLGSDSLGVVPRVNKGLRSQDATLFSNRDHEDYSESVAAFETLRERIRRLEDQGKTIHTVFVGAVDRGDGRTFVALNLAAAFSQLNKKVLVLEADFRFPSLATMLGAESKVGVTSLLKGLGTVDGAVREFGQRLHVLPAGEATSGAAELVASNGFSQLLAGLKQKFDLLLILAPPTEPHVDSVALARLCDLHLLVANYRSTSKASFFRGIEKIKEGRREVFSVLNRTEPIGGVMGVEVAEDGTPRRTFSQTSRPSRLAGLAFLRKIFQG